MSAEDIVKSRVAITQKIARYLQRETGDVIVVNVQNRADLNDLVTHFNVGQNKFLFLWGPEFCHADELPILPKLIQELQAAQKNFFVRGVSPFCLLRGRRFLVQTLHELLGLSIAGHAVILTYQCLDTLREIVSTDIRLKTRVFSVETTEICPRPRIVLQRNNLSVSHGFAINGIEKLGDAIESERGDVISIVTRKTKADFPNSLYELIEMNSPYQVACVIDKKTANLSEALGGDEDWSAAVTQLKHAGTWESLICTFFGSTQTLETALMGLEWKQEDRFRLWLCLVGLKFFGAGQNKYLQLAAVPARSLDDFVRRFFLEILDHKTTDKDFQELYDARRRLVRVFRNADEVVAEFCRLVPMKEQSALEYLTDGTLQEKEAVFKYLAQYGEEMSKDYVLKSLKRVYPDLAAYLSDYDFRKSFLNSYFRDYKYQKVINRIFPEFLQEVERQAAEREYNKFLPPRTALIEQIDKTDAQTYFTDAVGVEYLAFLMAICSQLNLLANVHVCRCELPSITSRNKDFWDVLSSERYPIITIDKIDKIKHHGEEGYDYRRVDRKLPIHLIRELELLVELLRKIRGKLAEGVYKKAILVSDHGASRLAVIQNTENLCAMQSLGVHSGRCCLKTEFDEQPPYAADADDFWALANYDRFKGGRKANVEVHGGATLEEVVVPIIELTLPAKRTQVFLASIDGDIALGAVPEIVISFRKKAALKIFATERLDEVSVAIDGHIYDAESVGETTYVVRAMPEIRKAKDYEVTVCSQGNIIASHLKLRVKKEGASENSIL